MEGRRRIADAQRRRWRRHAAGLETGTASFGAVAAVLIALAAVAGSGILVLRLLKKRLTGLLIGVHATLAVSGFIFLTAYIFVG